MERLTAAVDNWLLDRPTMKANNTPRRLLDLLCGELEELCEASAGKTDEELRTDKEFEQEIADVLLFTLSLCRQIGKDPTEVAMEKVAFNMIRYPAGSFYSGDFDQIMYSNRQLVKQHHIKEEFYA